MSEESKNIKISIEACSTRQSLQNSPIDGRNLAVPTTDFDQMNAAEFAPALAQALRNETKFQKSSAADSEVIQLNDTNGMTEALESLQMMRYAFTSTGGLSSSMPAMVYHNTATRLPFTQLQPRSFMEELRGDVSIPIPTPDFNAQQDMHLSTQQRHSFSSLEGPFHFSPSSNSSPENNQATQRKQRSARTKPSNNGRIFRATQQAGTEQINNSICISCKCGVLCKTQEEYTTHHNEHVSQMTDLTCSECYRMFGRKQDLKRHKKAHSPEFTPLMCENCLVTFSRKDALRRHELKGKCDKSN